MKISLYKNISENNVLTKNITNIKSDINVTLKENTSVIKPVFILSNDNIDLTTNYLYCENLGRYYYIDNITLLRGNLLSLECSVDVLMSFADDIKNADVLILNSESLANPYLASTVWRNDVRQNTEIRNFNNGFNDNPQFILITAGATI